MRRRFDPDGLDVGQEFGQQGLLLVVSQLELRVGENTQKFADGVVAYSDSLFNPDYPMDNPGSIWPDSSDSMRLIIGTRYMPSHMQRSNPGPDVFTHS
jgi:hypothetical protein